MFNAFNLTSLPLSFVMNRNMPPYVTRSVLITQFVIHPANVCDTDFSKTFLCLRIKSAKRRDQFGTQTKPSVINLILVSHPIRDYTSFINKVINETQTFKPNLNARSRQWAKRCRFTLRFLSCLRRHSFLI